LEDLVTGYSKFMTSVQMQFLRRSFLLILVMFVALLNSCSGNSIDSIKTDKDVFIFVKQFFSKQNAKEKFDNYYTEAIEVPDSLKNKHWFKADIDNNGETDLLVCGAEDRPEIFAILSLKGKYKRIAPKYFCKYHFFYPAIKRENGKNVVLFYSPDKNGHYDESGKFIYTKLDCDTLTVVDNKFVNYVNDPVRHHINQVIISNDGFCEGNCIPFHINIDAKKHIGIIIDPVNKTHTIKIARAEIDSILLLIERSNFSHLKDKYTVGCTDQTTTTLTVIYDGGKIKKIEDYGSSGNFTLSEIFHIAFNLKGIVRNGR
jgi:hypothetical protein